MLEWWEWENIKKEVFYLRKTIKLKGRSSALTLAVLGILVALSIVLGKVLSVTVGAFRVSLENLPVILAAVWFGPVAGMAVGVLADVVGSLLVGFVINPMITVGAGAVGLVAGVAFKVFAKMATTERLGLAVFWAHLVGSVVIKSVGLRVYYGYPWSVLWLRLPLYVVIGVIEMVILREILRRVKHF